MKAIVEFVKTTLIGGLLMMVPVYLTVLLLAKALAEMVRLLNPIVALLPAAEHSRQLTAIALVVLPLLLARPDRTHGPGKACARGVRGHRGAGVHVEASSVVEVVMVVVVTSPPQVIRPRRHARFV